MKFSAAIIALALSSGVANAAVFDWTVTSPDFYNPIGGTNKVETKTGNDVTLKWGTGSSRNPGEQSSYTFDGQNGSIAINPGETKDFVFGIFSHDNNDLTRSTANGELGGVSLKFGMDVLGDDYSPFFDITHNETLNVYSGPNAWPKCCDDRVTSTSYSIGEILKGSLKYTVFLTAIDLRTKEATNTATQWIGRVTLEDLAPVPLPPAVLLFGSALAGIGFMSKRRSSR